MITYDVVDAAGNKAPTVRRRVYVVCRCAALPCHAVLVRAVAGLHTHACTHAPCLQCACSRLC